MSHALIPHSRPRFSTAMQAAVDAVLQSGMVVAGREVEQLEQLLCQRVQCREAVVVDSGTSALMLALRLLARDRNPAEMQVGIPAFACASLLSAVRSAGLQPRVLDCDPDTLLLTEKALSVGLDAVVLVHPFGMVEPMVDAAWHCPLIEDIAQAADGSWRDRPLGSKGRITIASFHATKPWGGAYGGALLMDDDSEAVALRRMINPDGERLDHDYVGHHQLSDLHAVLARLRLEQSAALMVQRMQHRATLAAWVIDAGGELCSAPSGNGFRLLVRSASRSAESLIQRFRAQGVMAALPIKQPLSRMTDDAAPGAEVAFGRWVSLPLLADFVDAELQQMQRAITAAFS